MGKHIEIIARGVCVKGGKLLLCQTKGKWNTYLPGGHVEFGERAADSLVREVKEELGVSSRIVRFLCGVENTFVHKGRRHCEINLVFELAIPSVSPSKRPRACEPQIEFRWVPLGKLAERRLEPAVLCELVPRRAAGKRVPESWVSTGCIPVP